MLDYRLCACISQHIFETFGFWVMRQNALCQSNYRILESATSEGGIVE